MLQEIYTKESPNWRLPISLGFTKWVEFLIENSYLRELKLNFPSTGTCLFFIWENTPWNNLFEIASVIKNNSHLSHYSALFLHGLTEQIPKTVYISFPQPNKPKSPLTQEAIDLAFSKPCRTSTNFASFREMTIGLLNGQDTKGIGIITKEIDGIKYRVTDLEKTLIDAVIRPNYCGGTKAVVEAFVNAKGRVQINRLLAYLSNLQFIYPYHQAIGFYLEKAGFEDKSLNKIKAFPQNYLFYLEHGISVKDKVFIPKWNLIVPKELGLN